MRAAKVKPISEVKANISTTKKEVVKKETNNVVQSKKGRPSKYNNPKKVVMVFDEEELKLIDKKVEELGMDRTKYIRMAVLKDI